MQHNLRGSDRRDVPSARRARWDTLLGRGPARSDGGRQRGPYLEHRLREVLERDRALIAALPELTDSEPVSHVRQAPIALAGCADTSPEPALDVGRETCDDRAPMDNRCIDDDRDLLAQIAGWIEEELVAPLPGSPSAPLAPSLAELTAVSAPAEPATVEVPAAQREQNAEARGPAREPKKAAAPSSQEPIRTRTMARVLASQGFRTRALSIYDELLARQPGDAALRTEAEAVRVARERPR